ncbi:bacitracin ABC transporter ATP-binding protein [Clostridium beijerinckii]|uniref:ABC transporter ATP-binding protein n=1 Tax=Clostridium beijerinckii TaxID=1520 RepID=A0AB74VBS8_CLOBE|nr:ABC transporter ATP-binding protein [Clostridium beijerinckii]NRZ28197.1 ABC-2 type transport system ATP-binding protein [Clostridium beijerinckii]NYB96028.1 ABC-2 type transport system ATP-binding protein [Clostridium beijerinckii]OOM21367.1 putative ABC transporter ATP-binding protein YxlF [Clostridium beijerinckii]QUN33927.1 ABC transporter ATP-binding protein [Clostridium beijerinckii]SQB01165.1 multidrug ABC transporter ATPase [Clostridium beijerinckii]
MTYVLETKNLTKRYKNTQALDNINIKLEKGNIYGFVGQNGAGKTTLIRLITGLSFPTSGELYLFGQTGEKKLQEQRKRLGCMVETPALYPNMTAYQNLEIQRIQRGIPDKKVIEDTLELVGLKHTGKKKAKDFSLGMKQRLGIALALINDPEFLILDEPVNGLDPVGIVEIRELIKRLNKEKGMTILISSHILEELYQTADHYIIISNGKILESLTQEELNEKCKKHIAINIDDVSIAATILEEELHTNNYQIMPDKTIRLYDYLDDIKSVSIALSRNNLIITGISLAGDSLEDYFIRRIGGRKYD